MGNFKKIIIWNKLIKEEIVGEEVEIRRKE
jgi:hypothetical protein